MLLIKGFSKNLFGVLFKEGLNNVALRINNNKYVINNLK